MSQKALKAFLYHLFGFRNAINAKRQKNKVPIKSHGAEGPDALQVIGDSSNDSISRRHGGLRSLAAGSNRQSLRISKRARIEDWVVCIVCERFALQPGRPAE